MGIDLVGSGDKIVAVVELDKDSKKKIGDVARKIMRDNKSVKAVVQRTYGVRGKFRLSKHKLIYGKSTVVLHREYGYALKLNPSLVYFSPRESTVRQYVSGQVKPNERVLVMFAGVGPYAISIAKRQPRVKEVVAIEFNPKGFDYMKENIRINRVAHLVTPIEGDVSVVCKKFSREFDRVIMPMKEAKDFLELAAKCTKKSGLIQIYMISSGKNLFKDCGKFISDTLKKLKMGYKIENARKISLYAPGKWKVLMELRLK